MEKQLSDLALSRSKEGLIDAMKDEKTTRVCGTDYDNLLDDERLPVFNMDVLEIKNGC